MISPAPLLLALLAAAPAPPPPLDIGVAPRPGAKLPLDLQFVDEQDHRMRLGDLFTAGDRRPVVLALAWFRCATLCGLLSRRLATVAAALPGEHLRVVTVSLDPRDDPATARLKQGRAEEMRGWRFLTSSDGKDTDARALAAAVGVRYAWDPSSGQLAHPSVLIVITPDGRVARYLDGLELDTRDLQLAIVEASAGRVGGALQRALVACYRYDPTSRRYHLHVVALLRAAGAAILVAVAASLLLLVRRRAREGATVAMKPAGRRGDR